MFGLLKKVGVGGGYERVWPNKRLHTTATALASFGIIARLNGLGGVVGFVLPVRARLRLVKRSVSSLTYTCKIR